MKVLVAIKQEFAARIFDGTKRYEFRKTIFKDQRVNTVVVYVSAPVQKVIGEFEIESIIDDQPDRLWERTAEHSGITKDFFDQYFKGKQKGYAIKIKAIRKYSRPRSLIRDYKIGFAPQSYVYLNP